MVIPVLLRIHALHWVIPSAGSSKIDVQNIEYYGRILQKL